MDMHEAVIVEAVRTPVGRYGGILRHLRPDDLAALVIAEVVRRAGIDPGMVADVFFGASNQAGEDNRNVARMALLLAGLPESVPGVTVNRQCASSLQAVIFAAQAVQTGTGDVFVAGGVESMTRAPLVMAKPHAAFPRGDMTLHDSTRGWRFVNPRLEAMGYTCSMGETAENVAEAFGITRDEQDRFALASQQKAAAAIGEGRFRDEILPVEVPAPNGGTTLVETDEHPRSDTTLEKLAGLRPAFRKGGTVTAGSSSGINDGAAALVVMSAERAAAAGLGPSARVVSWGITGVDPRVMGLGPIEATRKALDKVGLRMADIDLVEFNEAFASQSIACMRELDIDPEKLNVNGGAIALGHPLGCTGARLTTTLFHEMKRREARYGLVTMCVGTGQGVSVILERLD